ncbi:hypothetical protein HDU98_003127, partial [Podochytrium sp. JEL0797]
MLANHFAPSTSKPVPTTESTPSVLPKSPPPRPVPVKRVSVLTGVATDGTHRERTMSLYETHSPAFRAAEAKRP